MQSLRDAYARGNVGAREAVHTAARGLGLAIAMLVGTLNAQDIVIAGSVAQLGEPFLQAVRHEVLTHSLAVLARATHIEFSSVASDITSLGAAAVLLHQELGIWPLRRQTHPHAEVDRARVDGEVTA